MIVFSYFTVYTGFMHTDFISTILSLVVSTSLFSLAAQKAKFGDVVSDPKKHVLARTDNPEQGIRQFECNQCSAMKGVIFIAPNADCGNAGCNYSLYKKENGSYKFLTTVFLHPMSFQFLKTSHHGLNDIISYHHLSADEGSIATYVFDGTEYKAMEKARMIKSSDFEKYIKRESVKQSD